MRLVKLGDVVVINRSGTVGLVSDAGPKGDFSINILKRGLDSKTAWFDSSEATILVPMSETFAKAQEILNSPLFAALREEHDN